MFALTGKTALVTGVSLDIGRSSALALSNAGAKVIVHDNVDDEAADTVVRTIHAAGGTAKKIVLNLAVVDGPPQLAHWVKSIVGGRLDILVACGSVPPLMPLQEATIEHFDRQWAINVRAPFFLVQQLQSIMCKGSSIVLSSPPGGDAAERQCPAFAAAAGAIGTLVKYFASALGSRGVRVNGLALNASGIALSTPSHTQHMTGHATDMSHTVVFLASDDARWITGDIMRVMVT
jgi:3-oxoacyl-[acyl-carrier protein] reductase